jgi:cell division protein FtsB
MKLFNFRKFLKELSRKNAIILLIISLGLVYMLFDQKGLIQRLRLAGEKASLENRIELLQKQNASMQTEITKLQTSDKEIERIAREKYFMHRNGEEVIKVEPK